MSVPSFVYLAFMVNGYFIDLVLNHWIGVLDIQVAVACPPFGLG